MTWTLEETVDAYLDGQLSREVSRDFERELARTPEVANALNLALALREWLRSMPPDEPPEGLAEQIAAALKLEAAPARQGNPILQGLSAVFSAAAWSVRGPAMVWGKPPGGAQPVTAGLSQIRWMLGPLASRDERRARASKKPLWRRALALAGI